MVIVYRISSVRERLWASDRASEHSGEDQEGIEHLLLTGSEDAHEDRLSACARHGSIPTPDLAVHHRRTDGLLSGPVGGLHVLAVGKEEEGVPVAPQEISIISRQRRSRWARQVWCSACWKRR